MSRRGPWGLLAIAFVVTPLLELFVVIQAGQAIGAGWTILLLILDSLLGAVLLKREGRQAWRALREALSSGRVPARELADGALILVGGTLLLTPGFITDAIGFFFILPFTRPITRRMLTTVISRRLLGPVVNPFGVPGTPGSAGDGAQGTGPRGPGGQGGQGGRTQQRPGPGVVQGEVVDDEDGR